MKNWLKGKKTYFVAFFLAVLAVYETLTGDLTVSQAIQEGRAIEFLQATGLATIRAGIAKVTG